MIEIPVTTDIRGTIRQIGTDTLAADAHADLLAMSNMMKLPPTVGFEYRVDQFGLINEVTGASLSWPAGALSKATA